MNTYETMVVDSKAFKEAELNLYRFTAWQNAGYVVFLLLFENYVNLDPAPHHKVLLAIGLLFPAVLVGNLYSVWAGFESDAGGHARGIRKSFDYGIIHGLVLMVLPFMTWCTPVVVCGIVFIAALMQAISSAHVNASFHAWFVASIRNIGYTGSLDPYMSRRRLIANMVWAAGGIVLFLMPGVAGLIESFPRLGLSLAGAVIVGFYALGASKIRRLMWSEQDLGSFERCSSPLLASEKDVARDVRTSFRDAGTLIMEDKVVLWGVTLWVITWTLGVMVLYFWKDALKVGENDMANWAGVIWIAMTFGRVLGNRLAVLPHDSNLTQKDNRLLLGGWLTGAPMLVFCGFVYAIHRLDVSLDAHLVLVVGVLLIITNRVGQEIVFPFTYARIHESQHPLIARNRAAVESLLALWSSIPLALVWFLANSIQETEIHKGSHPNLTAIIFGMLGAAEILVLIAMLLKRPDVKVPELEEAQPD